MGFSSAGMRKRGGRRPPDQAGPSTTFDNTSYCCGVPVSNITHDPRLSHPVDWVVRGLIPQGSLHHCFKLRSHLFHPSHVVGEEDRTLIGHVERQGRACLGQRHHRPERWHVSPPVRTSRWDSVRVVRDHQLIIQEVLDHLTRDRAGVCHLVRDVHLELELLQGRLNDRADQTVRRPPDGREGRADRGDDKAALVRLICRGVWYQSICLFPL